MTGLPAAVRLAEDALAAGMELRAIPPDQVIYVETPDERCAVREDSFESAGASAMPAGA
jgi:hypothetical protein